MELTELPEVFEALCASEINVALLHFQGGGGWHIRLGDEDGWKAAVLLKDLDDAPRWLIDNARQCWPHSDFAMFGCLKD